MIIKSLHLNNFRCHSELKVDFQRGINLIIGKNGVGKSSILESIGFALLNENNDRYNIDQIKKGEKQAKILLKFAASDGIEYSIEKVIKRSGSSAVVSAKMFRDDSQFPILSKSEEIAAKCAEFLGIQRSAKKIYKNVITAFQNKFVELFTSNKDNENIINEIFNTDIYRKIADFSGANISKKYKESLSQNNAVLESILNEISGYEDLDDQSAALKKELKIIEKSKAKLSKELITIENKIIKQIEIKNNIDRLLSTISSLNKSISNNKLSLSQIEIRLDEALIAEKIKDDCLNDYNKFETLSGDLIKVNKALKQKEEFQKKRDVQQEKLNNLIVQRTKYLAQTQELNLQIVRYREELTEFENKKQTEFTDIQKLIEQESKLKTEYVYANELLKKTASIKDKHDFLAKELDVKISSKSNLPIVESEDNLINKLSAAEEKLKMLNSEKTDRDAILFQISSLNQRIKDNDKASAQLKTGICPILNSDCQNIGSANNSAKYFDEIRSQFESEIENLKNILDNKFSELDSLIVESNSQIEATKYLINLSKETKLNTVKYEGEIEILNKSIENINLEFQNILLENNCEKSKNFDDTVSALHTKNSELLSDYKSISSIVKSKKSNQKDIEKELINRQKLIDNIDKQIGDNINITKNFETEIQSVNTIIAELEENFKDLDELKTEREHIDEMMKSIVENHDKYIEFSKLADQKNTILKEKKSTEKSIISDEKDEEKQRVQLAKLQGDFDTETLKKLTTQKENIKTETAEIEKSIINLSKEISIIESNIERVANKKIEADALRNTIGALNKKYELVELFRANLNEMGKIVASRIIERISILATERYRNISSKNDSIRWNADGKNYTVQLVSGADPSNPRNFDLLSGGEQVSVALAIRSALSSELTSSHFAIFDEPTINLDIERKKALADTLPDMLRSAKQAIIVTHDDIFEESAAAIIRL
jgi:exonuclease SbcC